MALIGDKGGIPGRLAADGADSRALSMPSTSLDRGKSSPRCSAAPCGGLCQTNAIPLGPTKLSMVKLKLPVSLNVESARARDV